MALKLAPSISPQTDPALAAPMAIPVMPAQPAPDPGTPPPADMGAPTLPDAATVQSAPEMPSASPEVQQDASALNGPPSEPRHEAMLHSFDARKTANRAMGMPDVRDPQFMDKLLKNDAIHGQILMDEARYKEQHPWGSMESAHPGVLGKIGHAFGEIGNVAGAALAPGLTAAIPGSHLNLQAQEAQGQAEVAGAGKGLEQNSQAAEQNAVASEAPSKIALNTAQANEADNKPAPTQTPDEQVLAAGTKIAQGLGTPADMALVKAFHDLNQAKAEAKPVKPERPDTPEQQYLDDQTAKGIPLEQAIAGYARTSQAPQRQQQQLGVIDGKVVELKPGMSVPSGTESLSGNLKKAVPTADETRRADLARNMNENLDQLEDVVKRRPDLFGPGAGRMTQGKMWLGSNDIDVGALSTIKEQMGMAMVGAHAMRNAQHVVAAADSIVNGYKNEPNVLLNSIEKARTSLATFQQDAGEQPGSAPKVAQRTSVAPAAPKPGDIIDGHRFKGGDPSKQANWEKVAQ